MVTDPAPAAPTLAWGSVTGAERFSITRTDRLALSAGHYGTCLADGITQQTFEDAAAPPPGEAFIYFLQGKSLTCGIGTLGFDFAGAERVNLDPAACP